jgi:RNA 2',3'-cyclic 3'-phosphodiesterase
VSERLFLALWPDDSARAALDKVARGLALKDARVIPAHNLHVTVIFLGSVDAARRACIEQAIASVRAQPFEFELTAVEWRRKTGIVWATAPEVPAPLLDLVVSLQSALTACQHTSEPRRYRLHVTLARDVQMAPRRQAIAPIVWRAAEFCLVASTLTPTGSDYTVARRWPLHQSPG